MSSESVYNRNDNFSGTLTNELTPDEIETMLANEFRHYVNKEIPSCILVESVMTLAGFFSNGLGGENLWLRRSLGSCCHAALRRGDERLWPDHYAARQSVLTLA